MSAVGAKTGYRFGRLDPCFHQRIANDTVYVPFSCPGGIWTERNVSTGHVALVRGDFLLEPGTMSLKVFLGLGVMQERTTVEQSISSV